mgnify:FL=1
MSKLQSEITGKIPPQAIDIEKTILGACLIEKTAYDRVATEITTEDFYEDKHIVIYDAISKLGSSNKNIDLLTVSDYLRTNGKLENAGGLFYLTDLTSRIASTVHLENYCLIVKQLATHRKFITKLSLNLQKAWNTPPDIYELISETQNDIDNLILKKESTNIVHIGKIANQVYLETQNAKNNPNQLLGLPSSISFINRTMCGYTEPDLIVVAARPGEGKTTFAINEAINMAEKGHAVLFFSLEMKDRQLVWKIMSDKANIEVIRIRSGKVTDSELTEMAYNAEKFQNVPFYMVDGVNKLSDIKSISRRAVKHQLVELIVVDYLGLVKHKVDGANREQIVSDISAELKHLGKELSVPVILLSQLSRPQKGVTVKPATIFDLKESGGVESNADVVLLPFRPGYYGQTTVDGWDEYFNDNMALMDIAKCRLGDTGKFIIGWDGPHSRFHDYQPTF